MVNNCRRRCILKILQKTQKKSQKLPKYKKFRKNHTSKKFLKFIFTYPYQVSKTSNHKWNISPVIKNLPLIDRASVGMILYWFVFSSPSFFYLLPAVFIGSRIQSHFSKATYLLITRKIRKYSTYIFGDL